MISLDLEAGQPTNHAINHDENMQGPFHILCDGRQKHVFMVVILPIMLLAIGN